MVELVVAIHRTRVQFPLTAPMKELTYLQNRLNRFGSFDVYIALSQTAKHPLRCAEKAVAAFTYHPLPLTSKSNVKVYTNGKECYLDVTIYDHNGGWRDQLILPNINSMTNLVDVIEAILS